MDGTTIVIRPYDPGDHEACMAVCQSNVPQYFAASELSDFADFLRAPDAKLLVAEDSGRIVGCGGWYLRSTHIGRLCWGMVHREHHRHSIGTALLAARLRALFVDPSVSEVSIDTSQHSAGFYERAGFVLTESLANGIASGLTLQRMRLSRAAWKDRAYGHGDNCHEA